MSKIVYYVAASLDGYIATEDHSVAWLEGFAFGDDVTPYDEFYKTVGAVVMGGDTYRWIMAHSADKWPYAERPSLVISRQPQVIPEGLNITQVTGDVSQIAEQARQASLGRDVWLVGGGKTAALFADAGELQRLFVTTVPIYLGKGIEILPVKKPINTVQQSLRVLKNGVTEHIMDVQYHPTEEKIK